VINRHHGPISRTLLSSILSFTAATAFVVAPAYSQTAPAAAVGGAGDLDQYKAGAAPAGPINDWINAKVAAMAGGDAAAAAQVRNLIAGMVQPGGKVAPGPVFLNQFATSLDAGIAPALKSKSYEVRLNAAIAVQHVAEAADAGVMSNSTIALLNDESPFVVLWGMKAARSVLPAMLRNPAANANGLISAVLAAVKKHGSGPIGGSIVAEAYDTLSVEFRNPDARKRASDAALKAVIPAVQEVLGERILQYQKGVPQEPVADSRGTNFLAFGAVWNLHTPAQKLTSMQRMSDLLGLAAAQQAQTASQADKESLGRLIGLVASAIAVVPESQPIAQQLQAATKVDERTPAPQILAAVNGIPAALKGIKTFAALTPPPAATSGGAGEPGGAGTQPSTATSTAPAASAPAAGAKTP
jgi:hypothetical protein